MKNKLKLLFIFVLLSVSIIGLYKVFFVRHISIAGKNYTVVKINELDDKNICDIYYDNEGNAVYVSDKQKAYKKTIVGLKEIKTLNGIFKMSAEENKTYVLFCDGKVKEYQNGKCLEINDLCGKYTDIASGKDFTTVLSNDGLVCKIQEKTSTDMLQIVFPTCITKIFASDKALYALNSDGKVYYYEFDITSSVALHIKGQNMYEIKNDAIIKCVFPVEEYAFFIDDRKNVYYWGSAFTKAAPDGYQDIYFDAVNEQNPQIPQGIMLLFNDIRNVYAAKCDKKCLYFLTNNGDLFLYTVNSSDDRLGLYKLSDSVEDVLPLYNSVIVKKHGVYYEYCRTGDIHTNRPLSPK